MLWCTTCNFMSGDNLLLYLMAKASDYLMSGLVYFTAAQLQLPHGSITRL